MTMKLTTFFHPRFFFSLCLIFYYTKVTASIQINDRAQIFSKQTINTLEQSLSNTPKHQLIVDTYASVPRTLSVKAFFKQQFNTHFFSGIYLMITTNPKKILIASTHDLKGQISKQTLTQARGIFIRHFRNQQYDDALTEGLNFLNTSLTVKTDKLANNQTHNLSTMSAPPSIDWNKLLLALMIIGGIWFLWKAFRRNQRPYPQRRFGQQGTLPGQDSQGFNQNGYGGTGGGFLRSVLGGIGGAMAGSWLYDKFFNSSTHANTHSTPTQESTPLEDPHQTIDTSHEPFGDVAGDFSQQSDWGSADMPGEMDMGGDDW